MSSGLLEEVSRKLDKYENFLELVFASLLVLSFSIVIISIVASLMDFSGSSGFYSPEAVVGFMASFLGLLVLADAFKLSSVNFTERKRMKTIFTMAIVGTVMNILVNTRLSGDILDAIKSLSAFLILLLISVGGYAVVDKYGVSNL